MKVLVTGSRVIQDSSVVYNVLSDAPWEPTVFIHGGAEGVDTIADRYARLNSIECETHPIPEWVWERVGPKAGPMRNGYMVDQADAVVGIWDGSSAGTKDTMKQAEGAGLPIYKAVCSDGRDGWTVDRTELIEGDQTGLNEFC